MDTSNIEIILIEDNPHEAELAIRSLKRNNLVNKLTHIDDGADALDFLLMKGKYADSSPPVSTRLVLLDLNLPRVSGLEILRALKSNPATRVIPIIVLTSSREEKDIVESYQLGVNSYIVKPVNFESFSKTIAELKMYWLLLNQWPPHNE